MAMEGSTMVPWPNRAQMRRHSIDSPRFVMNEHIKLARRLEPRMQHLKAGLSAITEQNVDSPDFYLSRLSRRYKKWITHEVGHLHPSNLRQNDELSPSPRSKTPHKPSPNEVLQEAVKFDLLLSALGPDSPLMTLLYPDRGDEDTDESLENSPNTPQHVSQVSPVQQSPGLTPSSANSLLAVSAMNRSVAISPSRTTPRPASHYSPSIHSGEFSRVPTPDSGMLRLSDEEASPNSPGEGLPTIISSMDNVINEVLGAVREKSAAPKSPMSTVIEDLEKAVTTMLQRDMEPDSAERAQSAERRRAAQKNTTPEVWKPQTPVQDKVKATPHPTTQRRRSVFTPAPSDAHTVALRQNASFSRHIRRIKAARPEQEDAPSPSFVEMYRRCRRARTKADKTERLAKPVIRTTSGRTPRASLMRRKNEASAQPYRTVDWSLGK
ncbi:hypothetical protein J8273_7496 [Carpediemonas membranifera]|uniref:Uncharacterized protein n=1 Tax=Carpediemonas membranifera TaxID=201153 RepID=A0A8J6E1Y2_9EUKA|nr:hypothetical protein J8273_7496 [Carpediemonas membranifera]|eukprot:KAG9391222.1 hypothetical protein J8273_7496 [Carpediemonas membranifera]